MPLLKSLIYSLKESRCNPLIAIHSMFYAATVTYLKVLKQIARIDSTFLRRQISETYHSKVLRLDDAKKIITINRNIELKNLDQVLPYRHAKSIILHNPHNIVVYECPCRAQQKEPCRPVDVCLIIGDPFVDLLRMFQPFRSRRISQEEALMILEEEDERGHVHTAWFKRTMLDRFYAICNCCKCCCLGMKFMSEHNIKMLLPSGYRASINDACIGCGNCASYCQFNAIAMIHDAVDGVEKHTCRVAPERCFGCGICENKCARRAITLALAPETGVPLNIEALAHTGS